MKRKRGLVIVLLFLISLGVVWVILTSPSPEHLPITDFTLPTQLERITNINATRIKKLGTIKELWNSFAFDPLHYLLAYANDNISILDASTGKLVSVLKTEGCCRPITFSYAGNLLAVTTGLGHVIEIWDVVSQQKIASLTPDNNALLGDIAFNPNGLQIAAATLGDGPDGDGAIWIWSIATKQKLFVLQDHTDWVYGITFRPDGNELASANADGTVRLWDTETGQETAVLRDHTDTVSDVEYNPTGSVLVSTNSDSTIRLWSVDDHRVLHIMRGHNREVLSAAINSDSTVLASTSLDETVRLWDMQTGMQLLELTFQPMLGFTGIHFDQNGNLLIVGKDSELQLWGIPAVS